MEMEPFPKPRAKKGDIIIVRLSNISDLDEHQDKQALCQFHVFDAYYAEDEKTNEYNWYYNINLAGVSKTISENQIVENLSN
jgi:hypothetical protein